jgi:hypothetical protein
VRHEAVAERGGEPAAVPLVDHREGDLGAARLAGPGGVAGDRDDRAGGVEGDQRDVALVVHLGQEREVAPAEARLGAEEAPPPRLLAEAQEERRERRLVVRLDRPDREARAALEGEEVIGGGHV